MTFNPFSEEKTDKLIKQFRHEFQELKQKDQIEVDEYDKELGPAELLRIEFINQMSNAGSGVGEMEKYANQQLNRYARRHCCGRKVRHIKMDGTLGSITWQCTDYRLCPNCRRKRRQELIDALSYHHNGLPRGEFLRFKKIHEDEYDKYSKRAQREKNRLNDRYEEIEFEYGKINQPDNKILFFSNGQDDSWGEELIDYNDHEDEYNQIKWMEILAEVPNGNRISGGIWQKPEEEEEKEGNGNGNGNGSGEEEEEVEKELIVITRVATSVTDKEEDLAYQTMPNTQVKVTSIKELAKALFNRTREWVDNVGKDKCQVFVDYIWASEKDIQVWNSNVTVKHIENKEDIYNKDDNRPLTPLEWVDREIKAGKVTTAGAR